MGAAQVVFGGGTQREIALQVLAVVTQKALEVAVMEAQPLAARLGLNGRVDGVFDAQRQFAKEVRPLDLGRLERLTVFQRVERGAAAGHEHPQTVAYFALLHEQMVRGNKVVAHVAEQDVTFFGRIAAEDRHRVDGGFGVMAEIGPGDFRVQPGERNQVGPGERKDRGRCCGAGVVIVDGGRVVGGRVSEIAEGHPIADQRGGKCVAGEHNLALVHDIEGVGGLARGIDLCTGGEVLDLAGIGHVAQQRQVERAEDRDGPQTADGLHRRDALAQPWIAGQQPVERGSLEHDETGEIGRARPRAVLLAIEQVVMADPLARLRLATQHHPALTLFVGDHAFLEDAAGHDAIDRGDRRILGKEFAAGVQVDHVYRAAQRVFHLVGGQAPADQQLHDFRHGSGIGDGGFGHRFGSDYS